MRRLIELAAFTSVVMLGCGAAPSGTLLYRLTFDGDAAKATQRIEARLDAVDSRDDVDLVDVVVKPSEGGLTVSAGVRTRAGCQGFEVAEAAVRHALEAPQQLALREVLPADDAMVSKVQAALGDGFEVKLKGYDPSIEVRPPDGDRMDVVARIRGLGASGADLLAEKMTYVDETGRVTDVAWAVWAVARGSELKDGDIASATVELDERGGPYVAVTLSPDGRARFAALTARLVRKHLAIVVDDEVMSVPVVAEPIRGGMVRVTLGVEDGTSPAQIVDESKALAVALAGGPIAENVRVVEEATRCTPKD